MSPPEDSQRISTRRGSVSEEEDGPFLARDGRRGSFSEEEDLKEVVRSKVGGGLTNTKPSSSSPPVQTHNEAVQKVQNTAESQVRSAGSCPASGKSSAAIPKASSKEVELTAEELKDLEREKRRLKRKAARHRKWKEKKAAKKRRKFQMPGSHKQLSENEKVALSVGARGYGGMMDV